MKTKLQKEHAKFIASSGWAKIRADIFTLRGHQCERCTRTNKLHVHHLTYDRFGGEEEPDDLVILCSKHHMQEHGLIKVKKNSHKKRKSKRAKKIKRVNVMRKPVKMSIGEIQRRCRDMDIKVA